MATDLFEAFSNWPRRARLAAIWVVIIAVLMALTQRHPVEVRAFPTVQWLQLEPVATAGQSTHYRSGPI